MTAGVWGAWTRDNSAYNDARFVFKAGDTMTGALMLPTPAIADNSTKAATTAFVNQDKIIATATDLNTIVAPGTYACADNTTTNGPVIGGRWYLLVQTLGGDPNNLIQRAYNLDIRQMAGG